MTGEIKYLFEGRSFKWVLEPATDAMVIANREGKILFSNAKAASAATGSSLMR